MDLPAILTGEVHLPLTESTTSAQAVELCNGFYLTQLNADDFKRSQAFLSARQQVQLELIDPQTGQVVVTFVNKATGVSVDPDNASAEGDWVIDNPIHDTGASASWLFAPVTVHNVEELEFLDSVGVGNTYPIRGTDNTVAYQLSQLLNSYRVGGAWVSGTMGGLCTGGFKLVYKGDSKNIPIDAMVDDSEMVAIVEILHGSQQGYLCLKV